MNAKKNLCAIVILCQVFLSLQCGTSPATTASGGDDFPNMLADAGHVIADGLAEEWANPAAAPVGPLAIVTTDIPLPDAASLQLNKRLRLPKATALTVDGTGLSIDPQNGDITLHTTRADGEQTMYDTIVFRVHTGDTLIVRVAGSTVSSVSGPVSSYSLVDGDGDGYLVNSQAAVQIADATLRSWKRLTDVMEELSMRVSAGEDGDFNDSADNVITSASFYRIRGQDTVYAVILSDADGDGAVVKTLAGTDSSLVDMAVMYDAAADAALLQRQYTRARMVVFADSTKNYAVRYGVENRYQCRVITWSIATTGGDSTFHPGDTIRVQRVTEPVNGGDTLAGDTLAAVAVLGSIPTDSLDDHLHSLYAHTKFDGAKNREIIFEFTAGTPIATGRQPTDGTLQCSITANSGFSIEIEADITADEITATAGTSEGKHYHVTWKRSGELVGYLVVE